MCGPLGRAVGPIHASPPNASAPETSSLVEATNPCTGVTVMRPTATRPAATVSVAGSGVTVKSGTDSSRASAATTSSRPWPKRSSGPASPRSTAEAVSAPAWVSGRESSAALEEEGEGARDVGRGDRGAGNVLVTAPAVGREHRDPGGDEVGEDAGARAARRGAGGGGGPQAVRGVDGPDREGLGVVGRARARAHPRTEVAGSDDREDAGSAQRRHVGLELQVAAGPATEGPRRVDDVGGVVGGGVAIGVEDPLERLVDGAGARGSTVVEDPCGDPAGTGCHAVGGPHVMPADHDAEGGGAVAGVVDRRVRVLPERVEPAVGASAPARREVRVAEVRAAVEGRDDHTLPRAPLRPQLRGARWSRSPARRGHRAPRRSRRRPRCSPRPGVGTARARPRGSR